MSKYEYHEILLYSNEIYDGWIAKYMVDDDIILWRESLEQVKRLPVEQRKKYEKIFRKWIKGLDVS